MTSMFCCSEIEPYRPQVLAHEPKFRAFVQWAAFPSVSSINNEGKVTDSMAEATPTYVVQLVQQVNFGALESKRYFAAATDPSENEAFIEVTEEHLVEANYQKLNTYKNFKCKGHNKFFELNIYQRDPVNKHHWRANIARPATQIDL